MSGKPFVVNEIDVLIGQELQIARAIEIPVGRFFYEFDTGCITDKGTAILVKKILNLSDSDKKIVLQLIDRLSSKQNSIYQT